MSLLDREKHNTKLHHNLKPLTDRLEQMAKNTQIKKEVKNNDEKSYIEDDLISINEDKASQSKIEMNSDEENEKDNLTQPFSSLWNEEEDEVS